MSKRAYPAGISVVDRFKSLMIRSLKGRGEAFLRHSTTAEKIGVRITAEKKRLLHRPASTLYHVMGLGNEHIGRRQIASTDNTGLGFWYKPLSQARRLTIAKYAVDDHDHQLLDSLISPRWIKDAYDVREGIVYLKPNNLFSLLKYAISGGYSKATKIILNARKLDLTAKGVETLKTLTDKSQDKFSPNSYQELKDALDEYANHL